MAARKNKLVLSENWKNGIRVSTITNRLYSHVIGECEMSNTQLKAADIILKKLIPDLGRVELSGQDGGPIGLAIHVNFD